MYGTWAGEHGICREPSGERREPSGERREPSGECREPSGDKLFDTTSCTSS